MARQNADAQAARAPADRMARIVWALSTKKENYRAPAGARQCEQRVAVEDAGRSEERHGETVDRDGFRKSSIRMQGFRARAKRYGPGARISMRARVGD